MTIEEVKAALTENPELATAVQTHVLESEGGKAAVTTAANTIYTAKIGDEVKNIHGQYDGMMLTHLDEKPGTLENGGRQKSYSKVEDLFKELKTLRGQKDSLTKDAEVIRLTNELKAAKENPDGLWHKTYTTEKSKWDAKEIEYKNTITEGAKGLTQYQVKTAAQAGLSGFEFKKEIPKSMQDLAIQNEINLLTANSEIRPDVQGNDQIIFKDASGAAIVGANGAPATAAEILKDKLKDILISKVPGGGGGADLVIEKGQIQTTTVEGKDTKKLLLNAANITTQSGFITAAEEALRAHGVTMEDPDYLKLKDEAYTRYKVAEKPAQ